MTNAVFAWNLVFVDCLAKVPVRSEGRPLPWRRSDGASRVAGGAAGCRWPADRVGGRRGAVLLRAGAVCRCQVRHPFAEDWRQLQGVHVSSGGGNGIVDGDIIIVDCVGVCVHSHSGVSRFRATGRPTRDPPCWSRSP